MAVANRAYGKNINVLNVGGGSLLNVVTEVAVDITPTVIDATVLVDATVYNVKSRDDYTVSFTVAYDPNDAALGAILDETKIGTEVLWQVQAATGGKTYSSTLGLLTAARHSIPDGGQTVAFEIRPAGQPIVVT